jgi:FlaA1/EpsC-like NDP-sugar epimerase
VIASNDAVTREPEIDWYSFLDRPRLPGPNSESLDPLRRSSILITGAGGSIGCALSARLAAINPKSLVLLDSSEQALFRLQSALGVQPFTQPRLVLGNVGDRALVAEIFAMHQPQFVFHAAAYKQVPLLEEHPLEAIENNALNTLTLTECAARSNGVRVVLLSTDKAVEPINILGATKRIAERITVANGGVALRLGNVLATEGSVSETFVRQISRGGPINITGRDQQRYFVTCGEAVDLLLTCAVEAPNGAILAPAIDRQYSIASLAKFLISVLAPGQSIPIMETESRSGDKPFEKLWSAKEDAIGKVDHGYFQSQAQSESEEFESVATDLQLLRAAVNRRDRLAAFGLVRRLVTDYSPSAALLSTLSTHTAEALQS